MFLYKYKTSRGDIYLITDAKNPPLKNPMLEVELKSVEDTNINVGNIKSQIEKALREKKQVKKEEKPVEANRKALASQLDEIATALEKEQPQIALAIDRISDKLEKK